MDDESAEPLKSEAMKREDWRGRETLLNEDDAPGRTVPESERDRAKSDQRPSSGGGIGTILPPD